MFLTYFNQNTEAKNKFQRVQVFNTVVLPILCRKLYFEDLKIVRQVCHSWNAVVIGQDIWQTSTGRFTSSFPKALDNVAFDKIPRWKKVTFDRFKITNTRNMFDAYWRNYAKNYVTTIELKSVRADCSDLILFLNKCPFLSNLSLNCVKFRAECLYKQAGPDGDEEEEELEKRRYFVQCRHSEIFPDYRPKNVGVDAQPITKISFQEQDVIPLCLLDWLMIRCHGQLRSFQFANAKLARPERIKFIPNSLTVESKLRDLILSNVDSLKRLECTQNTNGDRLIGSLGTGLKLNKLIWSQYHPPCWYEKFVLNQLTHWTPIPLSFRGFYTFLRRPESSRIESLDLELYDKPSFEEFRLMMSSLTNLKDLTLRFHTADLLPAPNELQLNFLNLFSNLESLSIYEDTKILRSLIIPLNFLARLPTTVQKLVIHKKWVVEDLTREYFASPHSHQLTSLHISGWIVEVTDEITQIIIQNLVSLRHLTIGNSQSLNDMGVTGLKKETCEAITQSLDYKLLLNPKIMEEMEARSLSSLACLESLSLEGCQNISDISCIFSITFPQLVYLNLSNLPKLTDVGLFWIGRRNPKLKQLFITNNPKITKNGIDHLVDAHKNICRIHASRDVQTRISTRIPRPESPFDRHIAVWH